MGACHTCCKRGCCGCYCPPNKTRCCHCRIVPHIPEEEHLDLDKVINKEEYNKWLQHTEVMEGRKWFWWLTFYVDLYCWIMIFGYAAGVFIAHLVPILHLIDPDKFEAWRTCKLIDDPTKLAIPCVLVFHFVDGLCTISSFGICVYILRKWSYDKLDLIEKLIGLSNLVTLALFIFEATAVINAFIWDDPDYQKYPIFGLVIVIFIGIILGWFIQYELFVFIRAGSNYKLQYPRTESQIVSLVRESYVDRGKVRVVGSKHSAPLAIYVDNVMAKNEIMISLDKYTGVRIVELDEEEAKETGITHRAIAKGGTCLGLNRENPLSTKENGLVYILEKKGFSLADLGGVVMQTVGGFTSMGCAGGTVYHDYYESIHSIRIIDGRGNIQTYIKPTYEQDPEYNDDYWGVIVSMGLMGIISEVTYNLKPNYNVLGSQVLWPDHKKSPKFPTSWQMEQCQATYPYLQDGDFSGPLDLFAPNSDPKSLFQLMMNEDNRYKSEFVRLFIWPQVNPNLVTLWRAHRERRQQDAATQEWQDLYPKGAEGPFRPQLYHEVGDAETGKGGVAEQKLLSFMFNFFDRFANKHSQEYPPWVVKIVKELLVANNPTSAAPTDKVRPKGVGGQYFGASWAEILPMDQEMWTKLLPMQFTELWFDIQDTDKVMQFCKEYWSELENEGLKHTGTFSWEFYPAKAGGYSDKEKGEKPGGAWLRPSYGRTSFRLDALWFDVKTQVPYDFFTPLWNKLVEKGIKFRPHWAKWYAGGNVEYPGSEYDKWSDYYAAQYPKWKQWKALRKKMDPHNIFVTDWWASSLDIKLPVKNDVHDPANKDNRVQTEATGRTVDSVELEGLK